MRRVLLSLHLTPVDTRGRPLTAREEMPHCTFFCAAAQARMYAMCVLAAAFRPGLAASAAAGLLGLRCEACAAVQRTQAGRGGLTGPNGEAAGDAAGAARARGAGCDREGAGLSGVTGSGDARRDGAATAAAAGAGQPAPPPGLSAPGAAAERSERRGCMPQGPQPAAPPAPASTGGGGRRSAGPIVGSGGASGGQHDCLCDGGCSHERELLALLDAGAERGSRGAARALAAVKAAAWDDRRGGPQTLMFAGA